MKRLNLRTFVSLFLMAMLSAVSAITAHALTISGDNVDVTGNVNANSFSGSGAGLTGISGANISSGTVDESVIHSSIARDVEVDSVISTHTSDSSAHHDRYTDGEAVTAIKAADGPESGLDADLLDGKHASEFASISYVESRMGLRGSRLWLLPDWYQGGDNAWFTVVNFSYLGNADVAHVSCRWYNSLAPSIGFVLEQNNLGVSPGRIGSCNTQDLGTVGFGWMVVESDEPVFTVAFKIREATSFARESNVPMIPIDCSSPQGYEFVCSAIQPVE